MDVSVDVHKESHDGIPMSAFNATIDVPLVSDVSGNPDSSDSGEGDSD